jgi:hypothetical protein
LIKKHREWNLSLFTGYYINHDTIWGFEGKTPYFLNDQHIYAWPKDDTGYYLEPGEHSNLYHVFGPEGYTKFYVHDNYIYGPEAKLPWKTGK